MQKAWVQCELEFIPKHLSGSDWHKWCSERGIHPTGDNWQSNRGGWIPAMDIYLRGADFLLYFEGRMVDVAYKDDVKNGIIKVEEEATV